VNASAAAIRSDLRRSASELTTSPYGIARLPMWNYPKPPPWPRGLASRASDRRISLERRTKQRARAVDGAVCRAVSAPPEAVSVQRASARRHQLSVTATPIAATRSGSSSWMIDTWLAAAAPPIPIHSAGDA
jgi:hypothetical protein